MRELYLALIADIIDSKSQKDRNGIQKQLDKLLQEFNLRFSHTIGAEFAIIAGDSVECLLKPSAPLYEIITGLIEGMYPIQFRFGIGFGQINTALDRKHISKVDGPVFHMAREALDLAHAKSGHSIVFKSEPNLLSDRDEHTVQALFQMMSVIRKLLIDNYGTFIYALPMLRQGWTQTNIASFLEQRGIKAKQPYISKIKDKAYWEEVKEIDKLLAEVLPQFLI